MRYSVQLDLCLKAAVLARVVLQRAARLRLMKAARGSYWLVSDLQNKSCKLALGRELFSVDLRLFARALLSSASPISKGEITSAEL